MLFFALQSVVDFHIKHGSTVNTCMLDMSRAFDKVNHYVLYLKLMKRKVPAQFLNVLINWYGKCSVCVKWCIVFSEWFHLSCGVRQGGVLSPILFTVYVA